MEPVQPALAERDRPWLGADPEFFHPCHCFLPVRLHRAGMQTDAVVHLPRMLIGESSLQRPIVW